MQGRSKWCSYVYMFYRGLYMAARLACFFLSSGDDSPLQLMICSHVGFCGWQWLLVCLLALSWPVLPRTALI
jgi:hypothetical protein